MTEQSAVLPPVRLPRALLEQARAEARRRDETLSQVIRRALRNYVAEVERHQIEPGPSLSPAGAALRQRLADLDAARAPDIEYRAVFSTGAKNRLRPGETWRDRVVAWVAREESPQPRSAD